MTFKQILEKYRKFSFSERDKGSRFERLMKAYLLTDPKWTAKFKHVWLWEEFPGRRDLGGNDTGIDLVTLTHQGEYWAVQCKCYDEKASIDKAAVDSFLSTSSRTFLEDQLKIKGFAPRLGISTTQNFFSNTLLLPYEILLGCNRH
jgi:predicted helicase